jgi:hypothetical protein
MSEFDVRQRNFWLLEGCITDVQTLWGQAIALDRGRTYRDSCSRCVLPNELCRRELCPPWQAYTWMDLAWAEEERKRG